VISRGSHWGSRKVAMLAMVLPVEGTVTPQVSLQVAVPDFPAKGWSSLNSSLGSSLCGRKGPHPRSCSFAKVGLHTMPGSQRVK
jgi:hypothetical protein